jgi:hypothetical protein
MLDKPWNAKNAAGSFQMIRRLLARDKREPARFARVDVTLAKLHALLVRSS